MTVYVAERGCYEDRDVIGVYATPDAAIAANPIPDPLDEYYVIDGVDPGWRREDDGTGAWWSNNLDWDGRIIVRPYEVEE